ncbi:MAG: hypothetical protein ABFS09_08470 [Thermodesulfobacteriota bacterium]
MTSLPAYHFPETDISLDDVRGQLLFFSQIFYLAPVEADEAEASELCTAYTPAPLGDDLQRFKQLMAELKGNEAAFYQGQLSNMALEYMENRDPETVRDIISNLQAPGTSTSAPESAQSREELWQARLLLKLAEMLRQEHKALAEGMAMMQDRQADLLKDLKGEEELQDLFHALDDTPSPQFPVRVESLISAWGHLLLAGDHQPWFLNCFSPEAAEPFFEVNEKLSGQRPVRLLRLPLPDCDHDPENYLEKRQIWLDQLAGCRQKTAEILHDLARHGMRDSTLADLAQMAALWTAAYSQNNPWPEPPVASSPKKCVATPHLEIYLLSQPISQLVAQLCALKTTSGPEGPWSHGLLAVLSCRSSTCK